MRIVVKIILTCVVLILYVLLFGLMQASTDGHGTKGGSALLFLVLIGAIWGVWAYKPNTTNKVEKSNKE